MGARGDDWYEEFWNNLPGRDDDDADAARLIGEMFAEGLIWRSGDDLYDNDGSHSILLSLDDQHLIRRIENAARHASEVTK